MINFRESMRRTQIDCEVIRRTNPAFNHSLSGETMSLTEIRDKWGEDAENAFSDLEAALRRVRSL